MRRLIILTLVAATAAIFAGCETTAPNTNNARNNTNNNMNANNITVVNNNGNANTGTMNSNANSNKTLTKEDYEKNKETYSTQAKGLGSKIGQGAEDGWLWTKVRADLLGTSGLTSTGINVDVNNAVVTLRGTIPDKAQSDKAASVAKSVSGVKDVKNTLKVEASSSSSSSVSTTDSDKKSTTTNTKKQ
ncbi:MAG TPA: BON domain-containing protein [Pyrinomonadaceae bacterium]|jgi:hypothetical protein